MIADLAASLCMESTDRMALIRTYVDDSGTDSGSPVAVAACFVSDVRRWTVFEAEWNAALETAGVRETGFHMADFVAHRPPFDWDEEKRNRTMRQLVGIVNHNVLAGMATAVIKADYDRLVGGRLREKLGNLHYTFAVQGCLAYIEKWLKTTTILQPVAYFFDWTEDRECKRAINDLFDSILRHDLAAHFGVEPYGWGFYNRKLVVPLQAADILAWEARKYIQTSQFTGSKPRGSFQSMVDELPDGIQARFFDGSTLPSFVAETTAKYESVNWTGPLGAFL